MKNNRAPLLCYFKQCASFCSHQWIQTRVTVQKRPIPIKIGDFGSCVTLKFEGWPRKIGHLFYTTSSFVHCIIAICVFKLELVRKPPNWGKICFDLCDLDLCMDITFVKGNNSWIFHHDTMTGTLWKRSNRWTDGLKWSQLKITVISPRGQWVQDYFHPQHIFQPQVTTDEHMDVCTFLIHSMNHVKSHQQDKCKIYRTKNRRTVTPLHTSPAGSVLF